MISKVTHRSYQQISADYDRLFAEGQAVLARLNPCDIRQEADGSVSCTESRLGNHPNRHKGMLCCNNCEHWGPNGCKVKSLACKLWLCYELKNTQTGALATQELIQIEIKAERALVPLGFRKSKYQNMKEVGSKGRNLYGLY